MTVSVLWLFPTVLLVALQCVFTVFPDHTHFYSFCTEIYVTLLELLVKLVCTESPNAKCKSDFNGERVEKGDQ